MLGYFEIQNPYVNGTIALTAFMVMIRGFFLAYTTDFFKGEKGENLPHPAYLGRAIFAMLVMMQALEPLLCNPSDDYACDAGEGLICG